MKVLRQGCNAVRNSKWIRYSSASGFHRLVMLMKEERDYHTPSPARAGAHPPPVPPAGGGGRPPPSLLSRNVVDDLQVASASS
eukprot:6420364-Pyramimonas_sp.AAC.1